jgi:hypothetical protein
MKITTYVSLTQEEANAENFEAGSDDSDEAKLSPRTIKTVYVQ